MLVFRVTNLFEREKYDADIVSSMVQCAIAELDRIVPYASIVRGTPADLIQDLDHCKEFAICGRPLKEPLGRTGGRGNGGCGGKGGQRK